MKNWNWIKSLLHSLALIQTAVALASAGVSSIVSGIEQSFIT